MLKARKQPGRTRERTHYTLTAEGRRALEDWVRTPAPLPRIQNEPVVRLLAADLVDPAAVLEGLRVMRAEIESALEVVSREREVTEPELAHRAHLLEVNHRYAERLLRIQSEWLEEAESVLES